jgi:hypothetical protein
VAELGPNPNAGRERPPRSAPLIASVLAALAIGTLAALFLPANDVEPADRISVGQLGSLVFSYEGVWCLLAVPPLGLVAAIAATLGFPLDQRVRQAWWISLGALAALTLPLVAFLVVAVANSEPLGVGWFLSTIAFVVAGAIPWVAIAWGRRVEDWTEDRPPERRDGANPDAPRV